MYSMKYFDEMISNKMYFEDIKRLVSARVQPNVLRNPMITSSKCLYTKLRVTNFSYSFKLSSMGAYKKQKLLIKCGIRMINKWLFLH